MHVIRARNVDDALALGWRHLHKVGVIEDSRAGQVLVAPTPVTTVYERPEERVLFNKERDANPFFHLFESMWMLAGRRDVDSISWFNSRMREFSDDGNTFHGAYGWRWMSGFGFNQLDRITTLLSKNPYDRRVVLTMWRPETDLGFEGKDFPCNTHIYFRLRDERYLDMTVCCRSNDIIWGAYGANAVHFSVLQEFVATTLSCDVGVYYQISNNFHAYLHVLQKLNPPKMFDEFQSTWYDKLPPQPLFSHPARFVDDYEAWSEDMTMFDEGYFNHALFNELLVPMAQCWLAWKNKDRDGCHQALSRVKPHDWHRAFSSWIYRRDGHFK